MSSSEKLIQRFKSIPSDFTFEEAERLLSYYGYRIDNKGKTSGSRVAFIKDDGSKIILHKPHNPTIIKKYAMRQLKETLIENGDMKED